MILSPYILHNQSVNGSMFGFPYQKEADNKHSTFSVTSHLARSPNKNSRYITKAFSRVWSSALSIGTRSTYKTLHLLCVVRIPLSCITSENFIFFDFLKLKREVSKNKTKCFRTTLKVLCKCSFGSNDNLNTKKAVILTTLSENYSRTTIRLICLIKFCS